MFLDIRSGPVKEHKLVGRNVRVNAYELADVAGFMVATT
jgi:hypothetical protein